MIQCAIPRATYRLGSGRSKQRINLSPVPGTHVPRRPLRRLRTCASWKSSAVTTGKTMSTPFVVRGQPQNGKTSLPVEGLRSHFAADRKVGPG